MNMPIHHNLVLVPLLALLASCSTEPQVATRTVHATAADHGRELFSDTSVSTAPTNLFACSTCHAAEAPPAGGAILPGGVLAGVTERPSYWAGQELDLLRAIDYCRYYFMGGALAWTRDDEEARAMYAYLASLTPTHAGPQPLTIIAGAADLPAGNGTRGQDIYSRSCLGCHGSFSTGEGRLSDSIPALPGESVAYFEEIGFDPVEVRVTFIEKVRHGNFLGLYGSMPPYSVESMSDGDLADLLAYLELY